MRTIVLFSTKGGNTEKVANEISSELNCRSVKITTVTQIPEPDLENYDMIIIGTGIHAGNPYEEMVACLNKLALEKSKTFALFVTWGGAGRTKQIVVARLKAILESKNQTVLEDCFSCYGGWKILKKGHPNNEDLRAARNWAKNLITNC